MVPHKQIQRRINRHTGRYKSRSHLPRTCLTNEATPTTTTPDPTTTTSTTSTKSTPSTTTPAAMSISSSPRIAVALAAVCAVLTACAAVSVESVAAASATSGAASAGKHASVLLNPTARDGIPVYGKWCGPGHGGNDESDSCNDAIDCACKAHDLCYSEYGYLNCRCDNDLVDEMKGRTNAVAIAIRVYFGSSPCTAPVETIKWCRKCRRLRNDVF